MADFLSISICPCLPGSILAKAIIRAANVSGIEARGMKSSKSKNIRLFDAGNFNLCIMNFGIANVREM
jgi:hypothetical protein